MDTVALTGYGEVGRILGEDLRANGVRVRVRDSAPSEPARAAAMGAHARAHGSGVFGERRHTPAFARSAAWRDEADRLRAAQNPKDRG